VSGPERSRAAVTQHVGHRCRDRPRTGRLGTGLGLILSERCPGRRLHIAERHRRVRLGRRGIYGSRLDRWLGSSGRRESVDRGLIVRGEVDSGIRRGQDGSVDSLGPGGIGGRAISAGGAGDGGLRGHRGVGARRSRPV
jgi:hypothetical protein